MNPKQIANLMLEKKATNIKIFDVRKLTTMTDYFILCDSESDPQSRAILNHIDKKLRKKGVKAISIEGENKMTSFPVCVKGHADATHCGPMVRASGSRNVFVNR